MSAHPSFDAGSLWVGMVHLPPLPGSPGWMCGDHSYVDQAVADAQALHRAGFPAVMVENFGDAPFFKDEVPAETIAAMTVASHAVRATLPDEVWVGCNVLRNAGAAAMAVAAAADLQFIRVNVLAGCAVTDQGLIEGQAAGIHRLRARLAPDVQVWADVRVKHAAPLVERPLEEEVAELCGRAGADAIIVSGAATGCAPDLSHVRAVSAAAGNTPVLLGSGATADGVAALQGTIQGAIIGTALKVDGITTAPVDEARAQAFISAYPCS